MTPVPSGDDQRVRARTIEISVRVEMNRRGAWELTVPGERTRVLYATLADAKRQAKSMAGNRPSELIIRDAYHRLLEYERLGIVQAPRRAPIRASGRAGPLRDADRGSGPDKTGTPSRTPRNRRTG